MQNGDQKQMEFGKCMMKTPQPFYLSSHFRIPVSLFNA